MPTFHVSKNAIEIRFHALIAILAIALIIFDTYFNIDSYFLRHLKNNHSCIDIQGKGH